MSESKNTKSCLVAVDDGYAQTKVFGENASGKIETMCLRSSVRPGRYGLSSISGGAVGAYETEEGDHFTVSEDVESEDTKFDGFHVSTMNRVLVNHALTQAGFGGKDVHLVTGLPVADFFLGNEKDEELIAKKRNNLLKGVTAASDKVKLANIKDVFVGCQAVAAFVDFVVGDDLKEREDPTQTIAVVDIGGRTTDIAVVRGGSEIDHSKSGTQNLGILDVYQDVSQGIKRKFRTRDQFPLRELDKAVRSQKISLWNEEQDVSDVVSPIVQEYENRIVREVERRIGSGAQIASVVFVGGGSAAFTQIAEKLPNGRMPEHPELANARGLFKYVKLYGEA